MLECAAIILVLPESTMSNPAPENHNETSEDGKTSSKFLLAPVIVAVIIFAVLIVAQEMRTPLEFKNATLYPSDFRPVPSFELEDQNGQPFGNAQLHDRWTVLFFGFTHCPDVCPMTLNILQQAYKQLGVYQDQVQVVLLSVDPERDTQQQRKDYIEYFDPSFIALGGEPSAIKDLTKSMYIHYQKVPTEDDNYLVDHSAAILIINPKGRRHAQITPPIQPGAIASDLRTMIEAY